MKAPFLCTIAAVGVAAQYGTDQRPLLDDHLRNAIKDIPAIGFGTWNLATFNASECVQEAIKDGYRHIDAAKVYDNQVEVGRGIAKGLEAADVERRSLWVTSKLWNDRHVDDLSEDDAALEVESALDETLQQLGLEYLDLYLMHFPISQREAKPKLEFVNTWKAMTKLPATGKVRHVGISNFSPDQLEEILAATPGVKPYAHQLEAHPYLPQQDWIDRHTRLGIHVTAYSPLANSNPGYKDHDALPPLLQTEVIREIAKKRKCSPAQVAIKWGLVRGTSVIPKSAHAARIAENWEAVGCNLQSEDMWRISLSFPIKRFNNPGKSMGIPLFQGLEDAQSAKAGWLESLRLRGSASMSNIVSMLGRWLEPLGLPM